MPAFAGPARRLSLTSAIGSPAPRTATRAARTAKTALRSGNCRGSVRVRRRRPSAAGHDEPQPGRAPSRRMPSQRSATFEPRRASVNVTRSVRLCSRRLPCHIRRRRALFSEPQNSSSSGRRSLISSSRAIRSRMHFCEPQRRRSARSVTASTRTTMPLTLEDPTVDAEQRRLVARRRRVDRVRGRCRTRRRRVPKAIAQTIPPAALKTKNAARACG